MRNSVSRPVRKQPSVDSQNTSITQNNQPTINSYDNYIQAKNNWDEKQNLMKKKIMYAPTSIPGQVKAIEID